MFNDTGTQICINFIRNLKIRKFESFEIKIKS